MASSSFLLRHPPCCKRSLSHRYSASRQRIESWAGTSSRIDHSDAWNFHGASLWQPQRPILVVVRAEEGSSGSRSGEKLWRSELLPQDSSPSSWSEESFLQRAEEEAEQQAQSQKSRNRQSKEDENSGSVMKFVGSVIEKLLVADFFFILFILAWFLAGLAEKAAFDTTALIDAWLPLWSPVFQPALGFFMAAALWSAVSKNWLKR
ncbi:hypothetical protein GOP47_0024128 [Adiantum capillus-veneris]|uniref:Uncharacterized protein n=1 Tax=Adiantum capillus-veneris TaxID=13818 RepID=A0A9D4U603_ADICA|nr:hypothetical protein GOP47_0024128 [Adiantum capillus-veneris]